MSVDPVSGAVGNPQSFNRYAYVLNNPLSLTDPRGLQQCSARGSANQCEKRTVSGLDDSGFDCFADGLAVPCDFVADLIESGAGVQCPDNMCEVIGPDGRPEYFWASVNGPGSYYNFSGPGALYYSLQSAGMAALNYIFQNDTSMLREYGGSIYEDANGIYSFTDPNFDPTSPPCDINGPSCFYTENPNAIPGGTTLAGIFHTHPFGGIYDTYDINAADDLGVPSFLGYPPSGNFGSSGCIWMYTPGQVPASLLQGSRGACQ